MENPFAINHSFLFKLLHFKVENFRTITCDLLNYYPNDWKKNNFDLLSFSCLLICFLHSSLTSLLQYVIYKYRELGSFINVDKTLKVRWCFTTYKHINHLHSLSVFQAYFTWLISLELSKKRKEMCLFIRCIEMSFCNINIFILNETVRHCSAGDGDGLFICRVNYKTASLQTSLE